MISAEEYASMVPARAGDPGKPIWEVIAANMKVVPAEGLAALPPDGASQIDHYAYASPKRDQ